MNDEPSQPLGWQHAFRRAELVADLDVPFEIAMERLVQNNSCLAAPRRATVRPKSSCALFEFITATMLLGLSIIRKRSVGVI